MRVLTACIIQLFLCGSPGAWSAVPEEREKEIEYLISYLEDSDCTMVRNGKSYSGVDGADHVRRKYRNFSNRISSTEDFIEYAASKSTMSGRFYEVQCPDEEPVRSRDWLLKELQAYRNM